MFLCGAFFKNSGSVFTPALWPKLILESQTGIGKKTEK